MAGGVEITIFILSPAVFNIHLITVMTKHAIFIQLSHT